MLPIVVHAGTLNSGDGQNWAQHEDMISIRRVVTLICLLLIGKSSLYGGSGFPLSLSEWSFTICLTPYNRK